MKKTKKNRAKFTLMILTFILILGIGLGAYFWVGRTTMHPVERAMNDFLEAFAEFDIDAMRDMAVDPDAEIFEVLEANRPLYEICAANAEIEILNNDDVPITVDYEEGTASVVLHSTNFNTVAFKHNISEAGNSRSQIRDAIERVNTDRPAHPSFQLVLVDRRWRIDFQAMPMRELLGDMSFFGDTEVTLTEEVLEMLRERLENH